MITVLVADDNALIREFVRHSLEKVASVAQARDGLEAVSEAARLKPDVVVLDLEMPGLDGFETAARIRSAAAQPAPVLVALTGTEQPDALARAKAAGFRFFIRKESGATTFVQELLRLVRERAAARAQG
jgi:CheY-like chemotaxis protein